MSAPPSYKAAFLALAALLGAFFLPLLVRGEVVYPHDNGLELGIESRAPSEHRSNRKFSDQSSVYVPEIRHHLHGDHESWLSTWNPHVELGRPSIQVAGFGPSSPLTRVLGWFLSDEFVMATWLAITAVAGVAAFAFLFFRALGLHPWACFAAAAGVSMGPFSIHYLGVVQLLSGVAWTFALLWLITRFVERPSFAYGGGIAFATYLLFITAYPQQIVWHAYLIVAYALVRLFDARDKRKLALAMLGAALCGVLLSAPIYLDLAIQAGQSARLDTEPEFFLVRLPAIREAGDVALYFAKVFDALWQGNPITIEDQDVFNGLCFTPFFVAMFILSWMNGAWRRSWPWLAFGVLTFVLTVWHAAYLFGVDHLGLNLSRFVPLRAGVVPWAVAGAFTIDRVLREPLRPRILAVAIAACPLALLFYAPATVHARWDYIGTSIAFVAVTIVFLLHRHAAWLVLLVVATVFHYGHRMLLTRPKDDIHVTSPLVEKIRELTAGGVRYACVGNDQPRLLPPNQEAELELRSIHSYNSLSSRAYQEFVLRLSEKGAKTYGRQFKRIATASRLESEHIPYTGLGLFVVAGRLNVPKLEGAGEVDGVRLYRSAEPPLLEARISRFERDGVDVRIAEPLSAHRDSNVRRTLTRDDHLRFELDPSEHDTLLFVSQQYWPQWKSSVGTPVRIDDFYQGVVVPAGTRVVDLRFRPFVLWSWIPQILLVAFLAAVVWRARQSPR